MKPTQERTSKRTLKNAIASLQAVDVLLTGVFMRDDAVVENDGFPAGGTGGGSGKGSHSDRTSDHATRPTPVDPIHADVQQIVDTIADIRAQAVRIEKIARKLTAQERSVII
jgi:hypothetical protein